VGVMIGSFRATVDQWVGDYMRADLYVNPAVRHDGTAGTGLDPTLISTLAATPGVAAVTTGRYITITSEAGRTELGALTIVPESHDAFRFKEGRPDAVWPAFQERDAVIVSEPYAYHRGLRAGDRLVLRTERGERAFEIAGVFYHYGSSEGVVMMSRATYGRHWLDPHVDVLGIYAAPGVEPTALAHALRERAVGGQRIVVHVSRALHETSMEIFDRTFAITAVLRALVMVVAFIGVLSALMALQLERARELAVLRANGLTPRQLWGLVSAETGLMGATAGLLAIPLGIALSLVLIFVVNRRSFGWTMHVVIEPTVLAQGLLLAVAAALLAGLYPAYRMSRTAPALALRAE
jgi:putative ABC transport system permease protein